MTSVNILHITTGDFFTICRVLAYCGNIGSEFLPNWRNSHPNLTQRNFYLKNMYFARTNPSLQALLYHRFNLPALKRTRAIQPCAESSISTKL